LIFFSYLGSKQSGNSVLRTLDFFAGRLLIVDGVGLISKLDFGELKP
jgi:hypothetical protein